jgi:hypothetical protein
MGKMQEITFICTQCSLKCKLEIEIPNKTSATTPILCPWGQKADYRLKI